MNIGKLDKNGYKIEFSKMPVQISKESLIKNSGAIICFKGIVEGAFQPLGKLLNWWARLDSNQGPRDYESSRISR